MGLKVLVLSTAARNTVGSKAALVTAGGPPEPPPTVPPPPLGMPAQVCPAGQNVYRSSTSTPGIPASRLPPPASPGALPILGYRNAAVGLPGT